ncbi:hypothetical protein ACFHWS_12610 [Micromonospora sp. LOL_013]
MKCPAEVVRCALCARNSLATYEILGHLVRLQARSGGVWHGEAIRFDDDTGWGRYRPWAASWPGPRRTPGGGRRRPTRQT